MFITWRTVTRTLSKLAMKALALVALIFLNVFSTLFSFMVVPCAILGVAAIVVALITTGFSFTLLKVLTVAACASAVYLTSTTAPMTLYHVKASLKDYVMEPLFIRSPVKYTM